jgi:hypothetical protein
MLRLLWGKSLWYPLDRRLGVPQNNSGIYQDWNSVLSIVQPAASHCKTVLDPLSHTVNVLMKWLFLSQCFCMNFMLR